MRRERVATEHRSDEAVDIRQVRREDQRRHRARAEALEAHAPHHGADEAVRQVVQSAAADQIWCGSFSTCQVWPLATSAWRSGVLPDAAALFCSRTALSNVGAGFS